MATCPNCLRRISMVDNYCRWCGLRLFNVAPPSPPAVDPTLEELEQSMQSANRLSGHWEQCPKCKGNILIIDSECNGTGRVMGILHDEEHKRCHGSGKIKCDYPGCTNGRIWFNA